MDLELVIRGGTLVTAGETVRADLGIRAGTIVAIGQDLRGQDAIAAHGKLVLPGAVDAHVHLEMATRLATSSDDWQTGTVAAACGGTTTVLDFVDPQPGETLLEAFHARRRQAEGRAVVDFGLHMTLRRADPATLAQVPAVIEAGLPSFKTYTTYEGYRLRDDELLAALAAAGRAGGLVLVHAENDAAVAWATERLLAAGHTAPRDHPASRPAAAEGEAVERVLALAEVAGAPVYVVHVSTARGTAALARARERGLAAYGETCPQYLLLSQAEYERPGFEGARYVCSPPLRRPEDASALWRALARGDLQTVATDHCPFYYHGQKDLGRERFTDIPGGLPGVEARLALLHMFGVRTGQLSLNRWVEVSCTAPARLFGLYPRKGTLAPGADADVVIFDPELQVTLSPAVLHERVDYTPYDGFALRGYPVLTLSRGVVLAREGRFVGPPGHGRYLRRTLPPG